MDEEDFLTLIMNTENPAKALETAITTTLELLERLQSSHTAPAAAPREPGAEA